MILPVRTHRLIRLDSVQLTSTAPRWRPWLSFAMAVAAGVLRRPLIRVTSMMAQHRASLTWRGQLLSHRRHQPRARSLPRLNRFNFHVA